VHRHCEERVGAAVLGGLGEHLSRRQGGRLFASFFAQSFGICAARRRHNHRAQRANSDVLAGDDEQSPPRRARIVLIESSKGALGRQAVAAPD
jgi:hypothetical protein